MGLCGVKDSTLSSRLKDGTKSGLYVFRMGSNLVLPRGSVVVETLWYKPGGRGFETP
jgi:hypothetical protein